MGSNLTSKFLKLVDQSSRDLFSRTQEESIWKTSLFELDNLRRSGDIRNQSRTLPKIDRNFACFWPVIIFWGATPKLLEFSASLEPDSDHVAKFRGDRPRDLEDVAA